MWYIVLCFHVNTYNIHTIDYRWSLLVWSKYTHTRVTLLTLPKQLTYNKRIFILVYIIWIVCNHFTQFFFSLLRIYIHTKVEMYDIYIDDAKNFLNNKTNSEREKERRKYCWFFFLVSVFSINIDFVWLLLLFLCS